MAVDAAPLPKAAEISLAEILQADGWERAKASIDEIFEDMGMAEIHAIDPESRRIIYHMVRRFQPRSVLEIGTNRAASTMHAAMAMKEYRSGDCPPRLVTLDLFDVNDPAAAESKRYRITASPRQMLARLDCADMVEFSIARSTDYLNGREAEFDFIIMDHDPSADTAYRDTALALRALRPGGQLLIHPYFPSGKPLRSGERINPGPYLAVRRLRREGAGLLALTAPGGSLAILSRE